MADVRDMFKEIKSRVSLEDYCRQHLQPMGKTYICPACGSGTGENRTPAFSIDPKKPHMWKCFVCNNHGDIFDLAGFVNKTDDKTEQLQAVASWAGIPIDDGADAKAAPVRREAQPTPGSADQTDQAVNDHTDGIRRARAYLDECRVNFSQHAEAVAYWQSRGFTPDEAVAFGIGYDPTQKRIVIPWQGSDYYYCSRDITGAQKYKYLKPNGKDVGEQPIWNRDAFTSDAFFLVEGALDALAVRACGFEAVALGSTGSNAVVQELRTRGSSDSVAILMLDSDSSGEEAAEKLLNDLTEVGVICFRLQHYLYDDDSGKFAKDACELLTHNRDALYRCLFSAETSAMRHLDEIKEERHREVLKSFNVKDPADVAADIFSLTNAVEPIATGIKALDAELNGGIVPGSLIVLGAISSLGKTTLCLQIADYIAEHGGSCLFVSIEQSAEELVSKSLSRIIRQQSKYTVSSQRLRSRKDRPGIDANVLDAALTHYADSIAPSLHILEGIRQPKVDDIRRAASVLADHDRRAPILFIDYLQLIGAPDDRMTDKQAVDYNTMALRQIARDMRTPIIAISSLNRGSYSEGVDLASFKESGSIEYASDLLLGLQPQGLTDLLDDTSQAKQKRAASKAMRDNKAAAERACELVILKNRNGKTGGVVPLKFLPVSNIFMPGTPRQRRADAGAVDAAAVASTMGGEVADYEL